MAPKQTWSIFCVAKTKLFCTMMLLYMLNSNEKFCATATQVITSCDFENGLCNGWQQSTSDEFDWSPHSGQTLTLFTGPDADHTTADGGLYMYIETSTPRVAGDNAKLELSVSGNGEQACLTFYYHMFGETVGQLNVYSGNDMVFSATGNHGNVWMEAKRTISLTNTVTFEGTVDSIEGDIAIDDVSITSGSCPAVWNEMSCNFDRRMCNGWQQSTADVFNWIVHTGSTPSSNTGPDGDHTSGSGYYMYIEASNPRVAGDNAKLELSVPGNGEESCLTFFYHMHGESMGTLNVYSGNMTVFDETGPHGPVWIEAKRTIHLNHTVTFEGIRGPSYFSDMAIDDVLISNGSCPVSTSCDFDRGLCNGWSQSNSDDFDWLTAKEKTPSNNTGPDHDHTSGSGNYMYIESSSPRVAGDNAKLELSVSGNGEQACLTFYYHMYGETVGILTVYSEDSVAFNTSGNHGNRWIKAEITILVYNTVIFEGIRGSSYTGDLAIDDVSINTSGSCPKSTETSLVPTTPVSLVTSTFAFTVQPSSSPYPSSTLNPSPVKSTVPSNTVTTATSSGPTPTVKSSVPSGPSASSSSSSSSSSSPPPPAPSKTSIVGSLSTPATSPPTSNSPGTSNPTAGAPGALGARSDEESKQPSAITVGASVGVVLLVIIGAAVLMAYRRRKRCKNQQAKPPVNGYSNDAYNTATVEQTIGMENVYETVADIKPEEK